jgi:molecular chaperone DnaK
VSSPRATIDFGIDLGTTNSAVAVLKGVSTEIIKNNDDQDVTPSAVGYGKNNQLFIGSRAKNRIVDKPEEACVEFKRRMGTEFVYRFKESGVGKSPEELSAEVLKSLKADVHRSLNEDIQAAVITVPAAFELHQCNATRTAAKLAGLKESPLVQEPVAAALAYGFQLDAERAYWLVYDFGGGTFDAALIKADGGLINVVHHGGDNFLGGSDIDWAVLEKIVVPKLTGNYNLPGFKRGSERWKRDILKLKRSVELAKIELTTKDSTTLSGCVFEDESGAEIDCEELTLTGGELMEVAGPIISRSIEICKKVLREKNLSVSGLERVILVGGPTKARYFREMLKDALGIPVDHSVDPLTVVARGAAVFAGTQKIGIKKKVQSGEYQLDLKYKPVGHEIDPLVGGKVRGRPDESFEGFSIEVANTHTQWRSGRISLRADGTFILNILAEKGERNTFEIELFNAVGTKQKTVPEIFTYTIGAAVEEQPLINSMGVALANNEVVWFFEKGAGLPIKKKAPTVFRTTKSIKMGEDEIAIRIPVVEGEREAADLNHVVGFFEIRGSQLKRDLPAGNEVELALNIDESRIVSASIYVPVLDEDFEFNLDLKKSSASEKEVKVEGDRVFKRMDEIREKAGSTTNTAVAAELEKLRVSHLVEEIVESISASETDADAAEKAEKRLLELKVQLEEFESVVKWPTLVQQVRQWLEWVDNVAGQHGSNRQKERATKLRAEVDEIIPGKSAERLERKMNQIQDLYFELVTPLASYWVNHFQYLETQRGTLTDQTRGIELFDAGRKYLDQNNLDGLKNVIRQIWELLPREVFERGFGSTVVS